MKPQKLSRNQTPGEWGILSRFSVLSPEHCELLDPRRPLLGVSVRSPRAPRTATRAGQHSPAILCIFMRLAWMRPLARRCLAMMQRMWSENTKVAWRIGKGLEWGLDAGLWMVMFKARLSSSTPVTCMSYGRGQTKAIREVRQEGSSSEAVGQHLVKKGVPQIQRGFCPQGAASQAGVEDGHTPDQDTWRGHTKGARAGCGGWGPTHENLSKLVNKWCPSFIKGPRGLKRLDSSSSDF